MKRLYAEIETKNNDLTCDSLDLISDNPPDLYEELVVNFVNDSIKNKSSSSSSSVHLLDSQNSNLNDCWYENIISGLTKVNGCKNSVSHQKISIGDIILLSDR